MGSLFDGSGGFPLAASMCGITPVFSSEIEPYPIAVTTSRFPNVRHYGDVSKINGAEVELVDVLTFGSPCQDLSVAGKRAGLKHEDNGDDETTRSGLFIPAVRIIKEMREATNGILPRFAVWENVPGAYSSHGGEDFRLVLEELIKIVEPNASVPPMPKGGWPYADCYMGDGWSIAYRTFDAQYWGVPQRRRRIYLVADFGGECAGEILFKREGLRGYFTQGQTPRQGIACNVETCTCLYDFERNGRGPAGISNDYKYPVTLETGRTPWQGIFNGKGVKENVCYTLNTIDRPAVAYACSSKQQSLAVSEDMANTLGANDYKEPQVVAFDRAAFNQGQNALYSPQFYTDGTAPTLVAKGPSGVCHPSASFQTYQSVTGPLMANSHPGSYTGQDAFSDMLVAGKINGKDEQQAILQTKPQYIVRRLTPTECARLQGFPDWWGHPTPKETLTDEEYRFWLDVRNTHAAINGKQVKDYSKEQILTWYNKLHTDSAEYKMWGNGIALPNALYVMQGIADVLTRDKELPVDPKVMA